jgi:hypothetical protein
VTAGHGDAASVPGLYLALAGRELECLGQAHAYSVRIYISVAGIGIAKTKVDAVFPFVASRSLQEQIVSRATRRKTGTTQRTCNLAMPIVFRERDAKRRVGNVVLTGESIRENGYFTIKRKVHVAFQQKLFCDASNEAVFGPRVALTWAQVPIAEMP